MNPRPAMSVPASIMTLRSNRSIRYPASGPPSADSSLASENGSDVAARVRLSSLSTGRKYSVSPVL